MGTRACDGAGAWDGNKSRSLGRDSLTGVWEGHEYGTGQGPGRVRGSERVQEHGRVQELVRDRSLGAGVGRDISTGASDGTRA